MPIEKFSFPYYIRHNKSENIERFINVFNDKLDNIPENTVSSRMVMKCLNLDTTQKYQVFQNAYMDFFKAKLTNHQ